MLHERTKRIDSLDGVKFSKTIVINITLDKYKEWEITIANLNIKANDNKMTKVLNKVKEYLREIHKGYLDGTLEEDIRTVYHEHIKPHKTRAKTPQSENVKKLREENRKLKQERKDDEQ